MEGLWFLQGTLVSSTNNTDRHDIAEILFKVTIDTIPPFFIKKTHPVMTYIRNENRIKNEIHYLCLIIRVTETRMDTNKHTFE